MAASESAPRADFLVAGLGNPGEGYAETRHNVGFLIADLSAQRCGATPWRRSSISSVAHGSFAGRNLLFAKPLTFMNRSGTAVAALLSLHCLPTSSLIVVHDDLDLAFGRIRLRPGGGHGGHNGVRSVIEALGTADFCRVRFGIGRPPEGVSAADHVLAPFTSTERETLASLLPLAAEAVEAIVREGIERAMTRIHRQEGSPPGLPLQ